MLELNREGYYFNDDLISSGIQRSRVGVRTYPYSEKASELPVYDAVYCLKASQKSDG